MSILKIKGPHVKQRFFRNFLFFLNVKRKCAQNFIEKYFFIATSIGFIPINFNYFAFKTENSIFQPQNWLAQQNYLYQSIQRRNKYVEICTFFGEAVRHSSKFFKVKNTIIIYQIKSNQNAHKKVVFKKFLRTFFFTF